MGRSSFPRSIWGPTPEDISTGKEMSEYTQEDTPRASPRNSVAFFCRR